MKNSFLALILLALLVLGSRDVQAQAYGPYYYDPYWDAQYQQYLQYQRYLQWQQYLAYLQQTDPYYDLHVMHYQLYLPQYPSYQLYQPCCFAAGVVIAQQPSPVWPTPTTVRQSAVPGSRWSAATRDRSAATSDRKKVTKPRRLKNSVCRLLCKNSFFFLSWQSCPRSLRWPKRFTSGRTKKACGTIRIFFHPRSRRRKWRPLTFLNQFRNRSFSQPAGKRKRKITRIIPPKLGRMLTHWGQPLDICSYFLRSTQVNLCRSGYQCNLSIAP